MDKIPPWHKQVRRHPFGPKIEGDGYFEGRGPVVFPSRREH